MGRSPPAPVATNRAELLSKDLPRTLKLWETGRKKLQPSYAKPQLNHPASCFATPRSTFKAQDLGQRAEEAASSATSKARPKAGKPTDFRKPTLDLQVLASQNCSQSTGRSLSRASRLLMLAFESRPAVDGLHPRYLWRRSSVALQRCRRLWAGSAAATLSSRSLQQSKLWERSRELEDLHRQHRNHKQPSLAPRPHTAKPSFMSLFLQLFRLWQNQHTGISSLTLPADSTGFRKGGSRLGSTCELLLLS